MSYKEADDPLEPGLRLILGSLSAVFDIDLVIRVRIRERTMPSRTSPMLSGQSSHR